MNANRSVGDFVCSVNRCNFETFLTFRSWKFFFDYHVEVSFPKQTLPTIKILREISRLKSVCVPQDFHAENTRKHPKFQAAHLESGEKNALSFKNLNPELVGKLGLKKTV